MEFTVIARVDDIDPAFLEAFFKLPQKKELSAVKCAFRFPAAFETMPRFFSHPSGDTFKLGVASIINRLKTCAQQFYLNTNQFDYFITILNLQGTDEQYYANNAETFSLFTQGIKMLASIANEMEKSDVSHNLKEIVLKELSEGLAVCGPGCFTNIYQAYSKLQVNPSAYLSDIRTQIGTQVAITIIESYNKKLYERHEYLSRGVLPNDITHYVAGIMNYWRKDYGFEENPDKNKSYDVVSKFLEPFRQEMNAALNLPDILYLLIDKLDVNWFAEKIAATPDKSNEICDTFNAYLNKFGNDPYFSVTDLFDPDEMERGKYVLSKDVRTYLTLTMLNRLINSKMVSIDQISETIKLDDDTNLIFFPSYPLDFSYVIKATNRTPFIIYLLTSQFDLEIYLSTFQNINHRIEIMTQIVNSLARSVFSRYIDLRTLSENMIVQLFLFLRDHAKPVLIDILKSMPDEAVQQIKITLENDFSAIIFLTDTPAELAQYLLSKCIQYYTGRQDVTWFARLSAGVSTADELFDRLRILPDHFHYPYLLTFDPARLSAVIKLSSHVISLLRCLNQTDRLNIFLVLRYAVPSVFKTMNIDEFNQLIQLLPSSVYELFLAQMATLEKLPALLNTLEQLYLLLNTLPMDNRETLLRVLGSQYCAALSKNTIVYFAYLMGTVDGIRQHALLNTWSDNHLSLIFLSIDHLYYYLLAQPPANKLAFIQAYPKDALSGLMKSSNDLVKFFIMMPIENYKNLFEAMDPSLIHSILNGYQSMQTFINQVPENIHDSFFQLFAAGLTREDLARYHGGNDSIYRALAAHQHDSMLTMAGNVFCGLFRPRRQFALPPSSESEQSAMRRFDFNRF